MVDLLQTLETQPELPAILQQSIPGHQGRVLLLNQAFYPDVVATAQHAMDLCAALVEAGFQVTVVASDRGYDNPTQRYLREEVWQGVRIARVSNLGLGKAARWRRAADFASFMAACAARVASLGHFDLVIALTSPPLISYLASLCVPFKADALVFWAMDLNPDEAIAAGWLREGSLTARLLSSLQLSSMRKARRIVALDRFMKQRLLAKGLVEEKIAVIPPWSHDHWVRWDPNGRDAFRRRHNLENKFVVMYSGNHSPCHPLETLVRAARQLEDSPEIVFCFVGGGSEHRKLREQPAPNIRVLPYQPLEDLAGSLSAADLHVAVMGEEFCGIVHPCKIYNILTIGAPLLYIGPPESHITDIGGEIRGSGFYQAAHGDCDTVIRHIRSASQHGGRAEYPARVLQGFGASRLIPEMVNVLQSALVRRR